MAKTSNFYTLWDFLDYWIFSNAWVPILFIIFLGVTFEIILVKTCEFLKKKLELWERGSSGSQKQLIGLLKEIMRFETFSGRVATTSPSEENGDNRRERAFSSHDDCEVQESHFCESHSSSGGTSAPLSMFHSEVKKILISHKKDPQSKYQAIHFSSSNLFSIMKTNSTKNSLPDDINFRSTFQFIRDKDLNVTPCPLVHLFLSGDQIKQVEENIRRKIPVNPKATLLREVEYLHHRFPEPLIYNLHSNQIFIPAKAQDTFQDQNAMQNQMIHEAHFTRQNQQFIYKQESVRSQHGFAQPIDFMRVPFSSSMQNSFQAQHIDQNDKNQHFIHVPCIVEIQDSTKGIKSDKHLSEAQYSIYFNDPNKRNYLVQEQHSDFQTAELLCLSANSFAEAVSQQSIMPEAQQLKASLDSSQYYTHSSMSLSPTVKRQRRKIPDNERKLSLKLPSLKAKKMSCSRVFPTIVCHTSENKIELRCKKKKIVHQRKMSDKALYLISKLISKLITPRVKKYFFKNLVMVILDLVNYKHFLQEHGRSPDTKKINYASSTDRVSLSIAKNIEHSSMVNTNEMTAPCSVLETNGERTSDDSVQHTLDPNLPKHEGLSEMLSESLQKDVSFPQIESHRKIKVQKGIQTIENVDELIVNTPNTQRCFPEERTQNGKNSMEIALSFSGINLLISLGSQKQEKNELKDINVQVITGSINLKEEKPLMNNITEYDKQADSEKLECNTTSNKKNKHQYDRMSDTSHNAMQATISEPFGMEIYSKLKTKSDTPVINSSHSALQEKLLDEKKIQELKHIDESSIFRKPQEFDRDKEGKSREIVPPLAEDLRVIVCLKQKVENVQCEMGQIHSENRTIQSEEKEVQSQSISTQTVWKTSSCPSRDPLQVEKVWRRTDKPPDREEAAGPTHPPSMPENLPTSECLIETTECGIPFNGKSTKTLDGHITEDQEDWKKDLCAVATRPFKTRKKSLGTKNVLGVKHEIIKVKKPAFSQRFCIRAYDPLIHRRKVEEKEAEDTLEVQSCHGVKVVKQALRARGAHNKRSFRCNAQPMKEIKMEKEMFQAESFTDTIEKPADSIRMDSFHVANIKNNTSTQAELLNSAELQLVSPTSEKLLMGTSLSQTRESNVPNNGNDTREIRCGFTQKAQTKFTNISIVRLKYMNKVKPPASKPFNIRGNKKKSKLDFKAKFKKISQAKAFLPEYQNTICAAIDSRRQGLFHHAPLKQGELASKLCVACTAESSAFYNKEKKPERGKQNPFLQVFQTGQHLWVDVDQRKETLPDLSPSSTSQEQPVNSQSIKVQKDSLQNALKDNLQMDPLEAEELQKTTKTENALTFPVVPKSLFPKVGTSSPGEFANTIDDDLEFNKISESELGLYPVVNDSETSTYLQMTFLQSSDSVKKSFVSRPKGKRNTLRSKKQTPVSRRQRKTMSETKLPQIVNFRYSKNLKCNKEIKGPQQRANIADACLDIVPSKVHILPNKKIRSSKSWTEKQRTRRLGRLQLMQEKSPNGRNSFSSMKNYEGERKEKPEEFLISKNSPCFIFGMNQEKDHNLVRSDKQLNQQWRTTTRVRPQTLGVASLCSATCPDSDEFQLERLEAYFSVSPLKFGKAKDNALSEKECDLFHERQHIEHTGDSEKEAKELSVSYINPSHRGEMKCYSTKMKHTYQEKKMSDETSSSKNAAPDINMSSKIENGLLSEKTPCFMQMKSEILCHKGKVTSDDIKEIDIQDKEEKQNDGDTVSVSLPQQSQHFVFYSHPSRDPHSHKVVEQRGRDILFVVEQDVPQQSQSADKTQGQYDIYTSISKPHSLKSEESQIDAVKTVRTKYHSPADGTLAQELNCWDGLDRDELENDLQATISESLNLSTLEVPRSKRQSKVFTYKALQSKMSSAGVTMKGRRAFVSKVLTIPQCGHRKNLLRKTLKSQISELLVHSGVLPDSLNIILEDPTSEQNKRLTGKLTAMMLETLGLSTPTCKESKKLKFMDKGDEMNSNYLTVKASNAAISQTHITAGCGTPKQLKPVAVSALNASFSSMPMSLDVSTCNGLKNRDIMWTTRFSHELHNQSVHEERSCHAHPTDKDATSNGTKAIKGQGEKGNSLSSQHFNFTSQSMAGPNSVKSGLKLINSATCFELERALYDGQAQPVNVNSQQSSMVSGMLQLLNTEELEIGSIPRNNTWDRNPRRKGDYPMSKQKAWAQKNLRTLKLLQKPSLMSTEKKSENCTLEFPSKRMLSPTTKQDSKLLNIARQNTGIHRKKRSHNSKQQLRKTVHVEEALTSATEDVEICPLKFITDELLLDTAERTAFYSRIPQRSMAEEKPKLQANLATTSLGPDTFFIPVLLDFKSQVNTIKLRENKSVLNQRFSTTKKKKPSVSKIIKINKYFITNHKKDKLRAKMRAIQLGENLADELQNSVHFMSTTSNRKNKLKAEVGLGMSKFTQTMSTHGELSVEGIIEDDGSADKDGFTMQVSLENSLSNVRKSHSCLEICEPLSNTTKLGKNKSDQSVLKEKSPSYLTEIVTSIARSLLTSKEFKKQAGSMRVPKLLAHKGVPSQTMKSTESQSPQVEFETQDFRTPEIKVNNDEINTDIKFIYPRIPVQHIKTELSHKIRDMYRKSAKGNCLDKAIEKRKEEFGQPILFKIASQRGQTFEADQKRQPDPFKPEVFSANMVYPKDTVFQKKTIYLIDQAGTTKAGEEFSQDSVLACNAHSLHIEKQKNEFQTGWETTSSSFALLKKQEKRTILGPMWRSYASDRAYLETLRRKNKAKISNVKSAMCAKKLKLKAKTTPVSLFLGPGGRSDKKEPGHSMQHQSTLELKRNIQNLLLKANSDPGCIITPVKKLTSVKLEKGKLEETKDILPQIILKKPSNQRQMSWSGSVDVSRKLAENIKEAHDHSSFKDIRQQFWVKSEHSSKTSGLQRRMSSELTSQKVETDSLGPDNSRTRRTKIYSVPQVSLQHEHPLKKGTWGPGMVIQPVKQFSPFRMANEFIMKQDIKPSSPQRLGSLKIMDKPLDSKEPLVTPRLMVQQQNSLLGSISSHVPHQPHTEEPKEDIKMSNKILKNLTQQLKKISNEEIISDMDHMSRSIEKLLLLIKEQEKRRKKSRGGKKVEVAEDIKTTVRKSIPFLNYSPSRTQLIDTIKSSGMFMQRYGTEPTGRMGTLWREQRLCVQGISLDYVYTDELTSKVIRQNRRRTASTENVLYQKRINMKVRKTTSGRLFNITGYRTLSFRKELRDSMKTQKELPPQKMVADLLWKELCASGYIASQIKKLREVRSQKPYIPPHMSLKKTNKNKRLSDNNSISSTVRKSSQYTIRHKEHQMFLLDMIPQNKDPLLTGQQVKELRHTNFNSHLEQEAYRVVFPEPGETDYSGFEVQRHRKVTDLEFPTAQSIKQGVLKDSIKHALSIPPRRGGPKKTNTSSSKEHDIFLMKQDTFQKKTCAVQELLKQSTSKVGLGSVVCPVKESFDSENTKAPKKVGMYHSIKNISHLSGREGLRENDTKLGSKAQASLSTDLEDLQKTGTAQRHYTKSTQNPRVTLNSVHCHKREPFYLKPTLSTTMKDSSVGPKRDLKGKEKAEPADSLLKLIRQKVNSSKKLRPKYLTIFIQNKEQILEFFLSCILIKLQTANTQKQILAKAALHSKLFKPVVEKAFSDVNSLGDQSSSSEGVSLHTKRGKDCPKNACKAFPMSNTQSLMDIHRITPPQVKKALKTVGNLDYRTLNTENGEQKRRIKELNQHHLSFSLKNLEEQIFYSPNCSYVQSHLEPQTKEALSEVGNMSSRTKELPLSPKDQISTVCECKPEWISPSVISEQTKKEDKVLLLESSSKTLKCPSLLLSKRKQPSGGLQISDSMLNESSPKLRISEKELLSHKTIKKKQEELYLPELFLHCLSLYVQFLHENEKLKGNIEYGVMKDIICLERKAINLERLELAPSRSTDSAQSNKAEPQCYKKEKTIYMKQRNDKPGSIVIKVCEPIPLPHFKLDKEKVDVIISSNLRQEKCKSQEEETGIKEMKMDEIIGSSITLKTKDSTLSYSCSGKKLTLYFDTTKQDKVQEKLSKSDMKATKSFISLPCLSHPNLNSRIKVGKDKSGLLKDCLPPLKSRPSLGGRKVPFSNPFNRDNACGLIELNYLPQKKEYKNNIPHLKDIVDLKHIAQKEKKPPLKHLLHGKKLWWHNKIQKFIQGNKNNLDVVQNKPWDSLPSHFLEWDLKTKEAYLKRITKFCLGSPGVLELSGAIGMYQELTDGLLSSTEKANHMPLKKRLQTESKEVTHSSRLSLRQKMSSEPQELQFNIEEKEKKIHEDKKMKNWNKPSIYPLSYSQVDTGVSGEEAMQIRTQSSRHGSKLQTPSDIGKIVYKKSTFEPVLNSVKCPLESVIQKEESTKTEKNIHLKENQSVSQKIQLDVKEIGKDAVVTNPSTWTQTDVNENLEHLQERKCKLGESLALASLPHSKLDIEIKGKEKTCIKIGPCSLHSQSIESSDAEKLYFAASSLNDIVSDPKRSRCLSYIEGDGVNVFERISMHPTAKHVNWKKSPLSCVPQIKRFKVDLEEQSKKKHESSREKVMLLRETCSVITSSDVFKLDISEEVETETMQSHVLYPVLQKSLPVGQVGSTKTIDNNFTKRKLHPPWEEEVQTSAIENLTYLRGPISMTKISAPPCVSSVKKHRTLSKKTHQWNSNGKTGEKQERTRHHNVVATKRDAYMSLLTTGQIASTKHISKCSKRKILLPEQEEVQTPTTDGSTYSSDIVLKAKISAPIHVFSLSEHSTPRKRKTPHGKIKKKIRQKQEKARKFNMCVIKTDSSMPSRASKKKDILGKIQFSLPPSKVKDASDSHKTTYIKSSGYVLKNIKKPTQEEGRNRFRKDVKDEKIPKSIDQKVKKLPQSCTLTMKELQSKTEGEKLSDLARTVLKLCTSQLQLNKFLDSQIADRKVYSEIKLLKEHVPQKEKVGKKKHVGVNSIVVHPKNIHLKTKSSPILPMQNLSDFQWKTRKQGGKVNEDRSDSQRTLTKKPTATSPQPISGNTRIKESYVSMLTRPPVSMGYFQKSKDSEEGIYIQSITGSSSISLHSEKHMSEEKEEAGMQIAKPVTHKYQQAKVQKLKDEQGLVLIKSPLLLDLPHPQLCEKTEFSTRKLRLTNPALQSIATEGKTEPREVGITVGGTMKDAKKHQMPQREDTYRKEIIEIIDRRGTDVTLKSRKSLLSQKLHRSELHMNIKAPKPKKHDDESESRVLRKMYTSKASLTSITRCKSVQVAEVNNLLDGLESKPSSPLPQIVTALSDMKKMTHKEDMCTDVRKGKQYSKQIEKTVDLTVEMPFKKAKVSPISLLLNTNKFVLNMKVLEKKVHENKSELTTVASRTFFSIPSPDSRYSQDKTQKDAAGFTKSPHPQENFQEIAQDTATSELAEIDYKCIVKATEHNVLLQQNRSQTSKCVTSALRLRQHPHIKSERKPTFPHHKIDFTRLGIIIGEKVLDMSFKWQKDQLGKYKKESLTKNLNWKKENEIKDNLSYKAKFSVSPIFSLEKIPLKKLSSVHLSKSQGKGDQSVTMIEQAKTAAKGSQQGKPKAFPFLNVPVPNRNQVNVDRKPVVNISPQTQSRVHMSNKAVCDKRRKEGPPLTVPAKKNLQGQKLLQTNNLNSLYACVPICPKSQKNRFTVTNLKRELRPKYSTMRIPKYPISKILGSPSRKRKLEYAFNKPKTVVPRSNDFPSEIIIRSLSVSMINPNERIVESKPNSRREFQEKLPDASKIKDILIHRNSFDTGEAAPGTVHIFPDKNNENKALAEHLFPIYKILKSVFEVPVENKIQTRVLSEILEEVQAYKPGAAKAPPLPESSDTSSKICATLLHTPLLKQPTPELKNTLTMHLVSKAAEIKRNQIPDMVNTSLQNRDPRPQGTISKDNSYPFYLKHIKMNLKSPKVDTIQANLKNNYERDFSSLSCVKTPATNVLSSNRKALTERKDIKKQESVTPLASLSNVPFIHVLNKFSEREKDNLLGHLCTKTVQIQTMGLPSIATKSYAIANGQDKSKPLFKCIHTATKGPKRTNQVLVLFDEKSFSEIDCDLQHKYFRSLPKSSVTVVSMPNALPKRTSRISKGSGSICKTVDGSKESSTLSFDKKLLQHVSLPKIIPQESSLCFRKFQEPANVPDFFPGLRDTDQSDLFLSDLKLQMTPEKNKKCHVWFQETSAYKHSASGTQQNAADLANSLSSWISDGTNVSLNTETSTDTVEFQAPEESNSEECVFIETNLYLTQDSQSFLSEVPKDISLTDIPIGDKETYLKPFSHKDPNDSHTRTHRQHIFPVAQPFYQSQNSRKCRSNSKMQPPDWLSHSSSSTVEIESTSSSIMFSDEKHWTKTTWRRTSYSLTSSTTESSIKLSLAKTHGKSHMYPQLKDRNKARSDLWKKSRLYQNSHYSHLRSKEKQTKKKRQTNQMPEPNAHWQNIQFYSERRENQPFFYVCVPADSMDVIPKTVRWVIPKKFLGKRNFQIPQVANISKPWNLWSSSKKLLGSLTGAFNAIRYG
ncbi:coiled-coil domain-containing protein 168 [Mus caroli]|uniref:Coiled-coil domain-containing protein 168 n=1 Tax=Mus caroli TaxID=10089 RepID=A0A6P5PYG4_MUSCR|nr:coiled-coil domain-containing protein 168 [Mus caroli]